MGALWLPTEAHGSSEGGKKIEGCHQPSADGRTPVCPGTAPERVRGERPLGKARLGAATRRPRPMASFIERMLRKSREFNDEFILEGFHDFFVIFTQDKKFLIEICFFIGFQCSTMCLSLSEDDPDIPRSTQIANSPSLTVLRGCGGERVGLLGTVSHGVGL